MPRGVLDEKIQHTPFWRDIWLDQGCESQIHVIENIAQSLGKDQRQYKVLVLGSIPGPADGTGCIPDPGFERFVIFVIFGHLIFVLPLFPDAPIYTNKQPRIRLTGY